MNRLPESMEKCFWKIFSRTLDIDVVGGRVAKSDTERWDSLKHVELVFELEEAFGLDVAPDDIVALYSDTDAILAYLALHAEREA